MSSTERGIELDEIRGNDAFVTMDGEPVPALGFGTYRMEGEECRRAVSTALDVGYRHIDTAMAYENERQVGEAIADADLDRDEVFLTTKIKGYDEYLEHDSFVEAFENCLDRLDVEYVDLLLVHWWNPDVDVEEPIGAMNELVEAGTVKHIGVSNYSIEELRAAMAASNVPIATNQVEYHPYRDLDDMVSFCRQNDVVLTAYSPLAEGRVVSDEVLANIGARYGKSASQVALRWLIQQEGVGAIPKASSRVHQTENFDVFDFSLTPDEMARIDDLDGPLLYRLNSEGGLVYRLRRQLGSLYVQTREVLPA